MENTISITEDQVVKIFTEWDTRFRENPEWFEAQAVSLLKGNPNTYGERCAPYFIKLFEEIKEI